VTADSGGATIEISGRNGRIEFAKSGDLWGAVWRRETGRRTRMHIGDTCFEDVYFTLFDDQLNLALDQPIRVMKLRKCDPQLKVAIVATPNGFALSPSDVGARFDLASKKFEEGSTFPDPTPPGKDLPDREVVYQTAVLSRSLGGNSVVRTWLGYGARGHYDPLQLRYDFSPDGKQVTEQGTLMEVAQGDQFCFTTRLMATGETVTLFVAVRNRILRQQFAAGGELLGKLELLVEETDSVEDKTQYPQDGKDIYNVSVSGSGDECMILYTRGNTGLKVYSCKTATKRYLGEASQSSMFCAGDRCVLAESGARIRFLAL